MAQKPMIQVQCERCERTELRPVEAHEIPKPNAPTIHQFGASMRLLDGTQLDASFTDLCEPCTDTVAKLLGQITKRVEKASPKRGGK